MSKLFPILLCTAVMLALSPPAWAQPEQPTPRKPHPTEAVDQATCGQSGCHESVVTHAVSHGPVNVNACDACHKLVDPREHRYEMSRPDDQMCTFCHVVSTEGMAVVHQPLTTGQCTACHDPHGGTTPSLLRSETVGGLCGQCHQDVTSHKQFVHGPVAAEVCGACHQPHASKLPKLLNATGSDLCIQCHASTQQQLKTKRVVHQAATDNCQSCHDAHASDHPMMLKDAPAPLCLSCHADIKDKVENSKVHHRAVTDDRACLFCHQPHASDHDDLLLKDTLSLCFDCHNKALTTDQGQPISDVKAEFTAGKVRHGPVAQGECSPCHEVHGGDNYRLLVKPYPAEFYAPFDEKTYELCYTCHNQQSVMEPLTASLTDFRNGDRNLHYQHVHMDKKGRTCRACHETHASNHPKHVRDGVPFGSGGWMLPIQFAKTDTGGSCAPGCHKPMKYDRVTPAENEPVQASTGAEGGSP